VRETAGRLRSLVRPSHLRYSSGMPKDDEKLLRQLSLVSFLVNRTQPATAQEIRALVEGYYGMSDQAFVRRFFQDREELRASGLVIETAAEGGRDETDVYYLPQENYHLPEVTFTPEELRALTMALGLLRGRFAYERPLLLALACLTHGEPSPLEGELAGVAVSLAAEEDSEHTLAVLARLEEAVSRGKTVCFSYYSMHRGVNSARIVDPYGLLRIGGHWYLVGRDRAADAVRTFRLSRIDSPLTFASKNSRDFRIPMAFDINEYRARPPWLLGAPQGTARLRVAEDIAWWVERTYPDSTAELSAQAAEQQDDAWIEFSMAYSEAEVLVAWVIGLGEKAELLDPPELRECARRMLTRIWQAHEDAPLPDSLPAGRSD
jgi:predicted DNA-binding transcriptional regulator YafY